jgi:hypothetical protein
MAILRRTGNALQPARKKVVEKYVPKPKTVDDGGDGSGIDYKSVIERYKEKIHNPKSAIRAHCVQCSNGSLAEVKHCPVKKCALYPFRMGENPFHLRTIKRIEREQGGPDDGDETGEDEDNSQVGDSAEGAS